MNKNIQLLKVGVVTVAIATGIILTPQVQAAVVFEQTVASPEPDGVESTVDDQTSPAGIESADDFVLSERIAVTTIGWWGVYDPDVPVAGDDFALRIFADDGGLPNATPLAEFTSVAASRTATMTVDVTGGEIYEYSTGVATGLELDAGTYYLSVVNGVNLTSDPVTWFWTEGAGGDDTNWQRDTTTSPTPIWTASPVALDLAFRIEGEPVDSIGVPVPPTAWLMILFVALFGRKFAA